MGLAHVKIRGIVPLLLANPRTANPSDRETQKLKELTSKKTKTETDLADISRLEWYLALYVNEDGRLVLPGLNVEASMINGAVKSKKGSIFKHSVWVDEDPMLIYDGPNDIDKLWESGKCVDVRSVVIQRRRVMRTRPVFHDWALEFDVAWNDDYVNFKDIEQALKHAGTVAGLGTYRPRFGRYMTEDIEILRVAA